MLTIHALDKVQPAHSCHNVQSTAIATLTGQALHLRVHIYASGKVKSLMRAKGFHCAFLERMLTE
ncbi:hypothetical protein VA208B3_32250 [Vibrio alginolyticus]|nr:hypothetical protein VA208B3_32250 [Vibrio alginolyticus]